MWCTHSESPGNEAFAVICIVVLHLASLLGKLQISVASSGNREDIFESRCMEVVIDCEHVRKVVSHQKNYASN